MTYRTLSPGQRSQVLLGGIDAREPTVLFETDELLLEAPNWSLDGATLYLNGNGRLWSLDVNDKRLTAIEFDGLPDINNDHVLHPDGEHIFLSAQDGHIYRGRLAGGGVVRVSPDDGMWHFLHGVSPDGERLAYVELATFDEPGRLAILAGGASRVVHAPGRHADGPEWSPDGDWIYFNTEQFEPQPGHAQLARIPDAGGQAERLVTSASVDWFPHLSPDAAYAAYISFPAATLGHPADREVVVKIVSTLRWQSPVREYPLFGGQGTINVNSWNPTSSRIAFVAYPMVNDLRDS